MDLNYSYGSILLGGGGQASSVPESPALCLPSCFNSYYTASKEPPHSSHQRNEVFFIWPLSLFAVQLSLSCSPSLRPISSVIK